MEIRTFIGFEVDEEYLKIAKERIETAKAKESTDNTVDSPPLADPELPL